MTCVRIDDVAAGGAGVGRLPDGMAIFVPRTAPGDLAEVAITQRKQRYAYGRLVGLQERGPDRVEPRCPHFIHDGCGGCQLQHLAPQAQRQLKVKLVREALRRIGGLTVGDPEMIASPSAWRYRARITLAARHGHVGLRRYDRPHEVFELTDCPITREEVMAVWHGIGRHRHLLPTPLSSISLRQDRTGRLHVVVEGGGAGVWGAEPLAAAVADPQLSIWWSPPRGGARVLVGPERGFPALAFEQVNPELGDRIRADTLALLKPAPGDVVWDLYGGVGDTAVLLRRMGADVWMVDRDRRAVGWARGRTELRHAAHVRLIAALVEEALQRLPEPDAVVVNPPRQGLHRRVARYLEQWGTRRPEARVAYVSCDPATLARDLFRMPSLRLLRLTSYDLFPQTSHVETVAYLEAR
jgi:23S rRNA (uracil1939-C5)-methyltransferase